VGLRRPGQHGVNREQHLIRFQGGSQMAQVLQCAAGLLTARVHDTLPIGLSDPLGRTLCPGGQSQVHRRAQFLGPPGPPPGRCERRQLGSQRRQVVTLQQGGHLGLLGLADDLTMGAHQTADSSCVCHPSRRAAGAKDNSCGNRQASSCKPRVMIIPPVGRQHGVAGPRMALGARIKADLPRQVQQAKAAGHRDRLLPVLVDHRRSHLGALARHQRRINLIPLSVQQASQDGRADLLRGRLQRV